MINARPHILLRAAALLLALAALASGGRGAAARQGGVGAGVVISNRAEATYADDAGVTPEVARNVVLKPPDCKTAVPAGAVTRTMTLAEAP